MLTFKVTEKWGKKIQPEWKLAFFSAVIIGLLIHMPVLVSDIPNHDGLASMYFDQNMITSGRRFMMIACGFSSFYSLPWLIGVLGIFFLGCTSAALVHLLGLRSKESIILTSGLLVAFPALTSTFAYVYTLDGYMMALFLAVMAVIFAGKGKKGFIAGGICLGFSMGTYQIYLAFAVILSMYSVLMIFAGEGKVVEKIKKSLSYLYMGILGVGIYYVVLLILLVVEGTELDTYQGINGMGSLFADGLFRGIKGIYVDFITFTVSGDVLFNNVISCGALLVCAALTLIVLLQTMIEKKWGKNFAFYVILIVAVLALPVGTNLILVISPEVNYHLLMRYQWVLYLIMMLAFVFRYGKPAKSKIPVLFCVASFVMVFHYAVTDNIAYSNLQKKYEKTYGYCLRLLDRIEQTEGYYQGMPIAMIGVIGDEPYPVTDITGKVTGGMTGMNGDYLVYTGANYQAFMKYYLGATLNFLEPEVMEKMYDDEAYLAMDSFPGKDSIRIIDGIMYIKTENQH